MLNFPFSRENEGKLCNFLGISCVEFSGKSLSFVPILVSLSFCLVTETMKENFCVELLYFMYWPGRTK